MANKIEMALQACADWGLIPTSFRQCMTWEEQVLWLYRFISQQLVPTTNQLIEDFAALKDWVENYLDHVDFEQMVSDKIDEIIADGTFEDLLTEMFADFINYPKSNDLDYDRLGRLIDETHNANASSTGYYGMQGGCTTSSTVAVFATPHYSAWNTFADDQTKLRKINLQTGDIINEAVVNLGHANGMCYDATNHCYFVAPGKGNATPNAYKNKIIVLDDNFTVLDTITTDINFDSICVDENGDLYAGVIYQQDYTNGCKIYKLDRSNYTVTATIALDFPITQGRGTGQDFTIVDGRIYYLQHNPGAIFMFDMSGNYLMSYRLKDHGAYHFGEVESISPLADGKLLIAAQWYPNGSMYCLEQFFVIDPIHNQPVANASRLYNAENLANNFLYLYVDNSTVNFTPDGSESAPFYSIDEALNVDFRAPLTVFLKGSGSYPTCRINMFEGEITATDTAKITTGANYDEILVRDSKIYFNTIAEIPSINASVNSDIYIRSCKIMPTSVSYLIRSDKNSSVKLESITIGATSDLDTALFYNNHGTIVWGTGNIDALTTGLDSITKWFYGKISFEEPFHAYSGTLDKTDSFTVNSGRLASLNNLDITFDDYQRFTLPSRAGSYGITMSNLSTSGTGLNTFRQIVARLGSGAVLSITKANQISFAADGTMTVNTDPTVQIKEIYYC